MNDINTRKSNPFWRKPLFYGGGVIVLICILLVVSAPFIQNRQNIKTLLQNGGMIEGLEKPGWMLESISQWLHKKKISFFHNVIAVRFVPIPAYTKTPSKLRFK